MSCSSLRRTALSVIGLTTAIGLWLVLSWDSTDVFFPPLRVMVSDAITYWLSPAGVTDVQSTLHNMAWGLLLGTSGGAVAGLILGQVRWLDRAFTPLVDFARSIPSVAMLPFAIALLGIGDEMKIFAISLSVAWPVLINTVDGVRNVPGQWLETAKVFGLRAWQVQCNVVMPAVLPRLLAGLSVAIPLSLIVAVTSEMVGTTAGIGSVIINAQYTFEVDRMWSGVLLLGLIGWGSTALFYLLERQARRWDGSAQKQDGRNA